MNAQQVREVAVQVRTDFEAGTIDRDLAWLRYCRYNPAAWNYDKNQFLDQAAERYPKGNCGLTAAYLWGELNAGQPHYGSYKGAGHTLLNLGEVVVVRAGVDTIVDVTADQFGGPRIYVGPLTGPWSLERPRSLQGESHLLE